MKLRTLVRDALFLNWALPLAAAPPPPEPLRYEVHEADGDDGGGERVFASLVLFRQQGLRIAGLPFLRASYPQLNFRFYVLDGERMPSVLFRRMLVPAWVAPAARLLARQPTQPAVFRYPRPSADPEGDGWRWEVHQGRSLTVTVRRAAPGSSLRPGAGPRLGDWKSTVRYIAGRQRGYSLLGDSLRRIEAEHPSPAVWPVAAELGERSLLESCLRLAGEDGEGDGWPPLHSAWLCPEIPFVFELSEAPAAELRTGRIPQAAASSRSRL